MTKTLAIVGRPNVGKSTLFNRLVGARRAIVDDRPGVTRDRIEAAAGVGGLSFRVVDTAGWVESDREGLAGAAARHTEQALAGADAALFVFDARAGVTPLDLAFARVLHRVGKPVVLIANKCEGVRLPEGFSEAGRLGLGEAVPVSAEHDEGMADLVAALLERVPGIDEEDDREQESERPLRLAIVGRPNVGKSTLVNCLLGEDRMLTGAEPGVTRDAVAARWLTEEGPIDLVDTAGLRRQARIHDALEKRSAEEALGAMRFAEVVVLVIDASTAIDRQDLHIGRAVAEEGRALVIAANKWDLVENLDAVRKELEARVAEALPQFRGIPIVRLSATTGAGVDKLLSGVRRVYRAWNHKIPTATLNRWLGQALERHQPPLVDGRRIRIRYATQSKVRPPTLVLFTNQVEELPSSYIGYLTTSLRQTFDMPGTPIRFLLRKSKNPYAGRAKKRRDKPRQVRRVR